MICKQRRIGIVGLSVAAGTLGAAAMMSATTPTARADDLTDLYNVVLTDLTDGQTAFTNAFTDFGANEIPAGLGQFIDGVNDDLLGAPTNISVGLTDILTNQPVFSAPLDFVSTPPPDLATALTDISGFESHAQIFSADAATAFASGDYGTAVLDSSFASILGVDLPGEFLLIGAIDQLGL